MWTCDECDQQFESFQAKANHVRWHHKPSTYTDDGLRRLRENARVSSIKRYGLKTTVVETRTCKCGTSFEVTYSPERKGHVRKTCSKKCAASREQTPESRAKKSASMKQTYARDPETCLKGIRAMLNSTCARSSSKAERALSEALRPHGFKRHKQVTVDGLSFDVDIVSEDGNVWVESDGEWHFRQVHEGHDFQRTQLRDSIEEDEALRRNVLLIRVNNQTTTVEEQVDFILSSTQKWDKTGQVIRLGHV